MGQINHLSGVHLNYLAPLLKWRVLSIEALRQESINAPSYFNFCRIIRSLEKAKIVEGYRHPFNRKKYVFLSPFGEGQLAIDENPSAISKDCLIHDIRVSEVARNLLEHGFVREVKLEHELSDKRTFKPIYKVIPDVQLEGIKGGINFKIALELELTRKSNHRIGEKAKLYAKSGYYHNMIYLFAKERLMEKYIEVIKSKIPDEDYKRFIFLADPLMTTNPSPLTEIKGVFKDKKIKFGELF